MLKDESQPGEGVIFHTLVLNPILIPPFAGEEIKNRIKNKIRRRSPLDRLQITRAARDPSSGSHHSTTPAIPAAGRSLFLRPRYAMKEDVAGMLRGPAQKGFGRDVNAEGQGECVAV